MDGGGETARDGDDARSERVEAMQEGGQHGWSSEMHEGEGGRVKKSIRQVRLARDTAGARCTCLTCELIRKQVLLVQGLDNTHMHK